MIQLKYINKKNNFDLINQYITSPVLNGQTIHKGPNVFFYP